MFRDSKNWNYISCLKIPWEFLYINCFFAMKFGTLISHLWWSTEPVPATAAVAKDSKHHRLEDGREAGIAICSLTLAIKTSPKSLHPGHWSVGPKNCHSTHSRSTLSATSFCQMFQTSHPLSPRFGWWSRCPKTPRCCWRVSSASAICPVFLRLVTCVGYLDGWGWITSADLDRFGRIVVSKFNLNG